MSLGALLRISNPTVFILNPLDVILAEIITGLHFDQMNVFATRIFQSMQRLNRNVDGFVGINEHFLVADADFGHALDDGPMLTPTVMLL